MTLPEWHSTDKELIIARGRMKFWHNVMHEADDAGSIPIEGVSEPEMRASAWEAEVAFASRFMELYAAEGAGKSAPDS
ncbi:hypothetical protein [Streptodolium elevatio]|uniref:Uncharacterized protein n=1 Tax=Streptodolium elevatio TaxID=3157996 RepID=A0ABV3DE24_9ACTN